MNGWTDTGIFLKLVFLVAAVSLANGTSEARALEIEAGPGWFIPYGDWSRGFSDGSALQIVALYPLSNDMNIGAGFQLLSMSSEAGHASLDFLMPAAVFEYRFGPVLAPFVPRLIAQGGMAREVLEVGTGKESDFDIFVRAGGGLSLPAGDRVALNVEVTHLWFLATDGGRGITVVPSVRVSF